MAVITSDDVINRFRSDVDDPLRGPVDDPDVDALWKIVDVNGYLEDAVERVALKTLVQFKTLALQVTADDPYVKLPSSLQVLDIERAYLEGANRELWPQNVDTPMRRLGDYGAPFVTLTSNWETATGTPARYLRDETPNRLRLVPIPTAADTLRVTAKTVPFFVAGMPLPFTTREDQHLVLLWMKKLAYSKHDADTYDPQRAEKFEAEFEARGVDRKYEAQRLRHAVQPNMFSW